MARQDEDLTSTAGFLLSSRNLFMVVVIAQMFLVFNGEYLYKISQGAASLYLFIPITMAGYLLLVTKLTNGKPVTMEMLESSLRARKDPLSRYLRKAGWSAEYFSFGVQLIYFSLAFMATYAILAFAVWHGYLTVGVLDPVSARSAIIMTVLLVAPSETLLFHGLMPLWAELTFKKSQYCVLITYIVSQAIFAAFHVSAYGGSTGSMLFAFFMGIIFLWVARTAGLAAACGTHAAWNLVIYGVGMTAMTGA